MFFHFTPSARATFKHVKFMIQHRKDRCHGQVQTKLYSHSKYQKYKKKHVSIGQWVETISLSADLLGTVGNIVGT